MGIPVITIDGPTASGKGTICRMVAEKLNWHILDSGALYRLVALSALQKKVPLDAQERLSAEARALDIRFAASQSDPDNTIVFLGNQNVTDEIRQEECGNVASKVAVLPSVREALLDRQRAFRQSPGLVADGRDMGTVVFPDAVLKIFLTASAEERANRRYKQLKGKGIDVNLGDLFAEVLQRDERDTMRATAPLVPAEDAHQLDTTEMSPSDVVDHVIQLYSNCASV